MIPCVGLCRAAPDVDEGVGAKPCSLGHAVLLAFLASSAATLLWWFVPMPVGRRVGVWLAELVAGA